MTDNNPLRGTIVPDYIRIFTIVEDAELMLTVTNETNEEKSVIFNVEFPDDVEWAAGYPGNTLQGEGELYIEETIEPDRQLPLQIKEISHSRNAIESEDVKSSIKIDGEILESKDITIHFYNNAVAQSQN